MGRRPSRFGCHMHADYRVHPWDRVHSHALNYLQFDHRCSVVLGDTQMPARPPVADWASPPFDFRITALRDAVEWCWRRSSANDETAHDSCLPSHFFWRTCLRKQGAGGRLHHANAHRLTPGHATRIAEEIKI